MVIQGSQKLTGAEVKSYGDHRIGMMLSLAGSFAEGETGIDDVACINVSNPTFYEILDSLKR